MTVRLRKWFTITNIPGSPDPNIKFGRYHRTIPGTDPPVVDESDDGEDGKKYIVELMDDKASALIAPCPDFCQDEETPRSRNPISRKDLLAYRRKAKSLAGLMKYINNRTELLKRIK